MTTETTSRHVMGATEVLLYIPIKTGFVRFDEQIVSYASRLRQLLTALFELRRVGTERDSITSAGPIERLQTLSSVQWTVLEDESILLVAASFDRSWEGYFRLLSDHTGALLDAIFCHCKGFQGNSCEDGFEPFMRWVRSYQKPCNFFYSANTDLTADDGRLLRQMVRAVDENLVAKALGKERVRNVLRPETKFAPYKSPSRESVERALLGLFELRKLFSRDEIVGPNRRSEQRIYDGAISQLFSSESGQLDAIAKGGAAGSPHPADFDAWVRELPGLEAARLSRLFTNTAREVALEKADLDTIQAGILRPYPSTSHGAAVMLQCDTQAAWVDLLDYLSHYVSTEANVQPRGVDRPRTPFVNVGLTYPGLERFALSDAVLKRLPKEFREGMVARAGLLGDLGDPRYVDQPGFPCTDGTAGHIPVNAADVVVLLQTTEPTQADAVASGDGLVHPLQSWLEALQRALPGTHVLHIQPLERTGDSTQPEREHFGYIDEAAHAAPQSATSSQPVPCVRLPDTTLLHTGAADGDIVPLGELLLGYENWRKEVVKCVDQSRDLDLFRNGSFMVMRKLRQKVPEFHAYVMEEAARSLQPVASPSTPDAKRTQLETFRAWLLGRDDHGKPLEARDSDHLNDFAYRTTACPAFAHIRRANPRESTLGKVPRILRRGFSYGPQYDEHVPSSRNLDRGLLFMAYNASIAEQFEVIQRWVNGGNSTGLLSTQKDVLAGQGEPSQLKYWVEDGSGALVAVHPPKQTFVELQWGVYLFMPSKAVLTRLARVGARGTPSDEPQAASAALYQVGSSPSSDRVHEGQKTIKRLRALEASDSLAAIDAWKQVLEGDPSGAMQLWAAVSSEPGGVLETPYGVLVADLELARTILQDAGDVFSVQEYGNRLGRLIGEHYLGIDPKAGAYAELASIPNKLLHGIAADDAYRLATTAAGKILEALPGPVGGDSHRAEISLRSLAEQVVFVVCKQWFGLDNVEKLKALVFTSRYAFQVQPGQWLHDKVHSERGAIHAPQRQSALRTLREQLQDASYPEDKIQLALDGAMVGFAAPAIASITVVLDEWLQNGELARLAQRLPTLDAAYAEVAQQVLPVLLGTLADQPIPSLLYRRALGNTTLGGVAVQQNALVILGLGALYENAVKDGAEAPERWLFGGGSRNEADSPTLAKRTAQEASRATNDHTQHGCPARNAALAVLIGTFAAVMRRSDVRRERRYTISYS